MKLDEITPLILTHNEEANIGRTLGALAWARRIVVVDSGSTDATAAIVGRFQNAELIERTFDNHTAQWNFGLDQVRSEWVLTLDADYECPPELAEELRSLSPLSGAYRARFRYCVARRPLRGTLYPPRVVLFRAGEYRYEQDGHTQQLNAAGPFGELRSVILHDDRKPLTRWLAAQSKYADLEVAKLLSTPPGRLGWKDRLRRRTFFAVPLTFWYCLIAKGLILDGWPGMFYTLQRVYAELLLFMKLLDARLNRRLNSESGGRGERASAAGHDRLPADVAARGERIPGREVVR